MKLGKICVDSKNLISTKFQENEIHQIKIMQISDQYSKIGDSKENRKITSDQEYMLFDHLSQNSQNWSSRNTI